MLYYFVWDYPDYFPTKISVIVPEKAKINDLNQSN